MVAGIQHLFSGAIVVTQRVHWMNSAFVGTPEYMHFILARHSVLAGEAVSVRFHQVH
jgi:hypothetical protein